MKLIGKTLYACAVVYLFIMKFCSGKDSIEEWKFIAWLSIVAFFLVVVWEDDGPDNLRDWWRK